MQKIFSKFFIFKPTPNDFIKILSLIEILSLTLFSKCIIICSENLPDLPDTNPIEFLASPFIIIASLPTHDKIFKPLLPPSLGYLIETPG